MSIQSEISPEEWAVRVDLAAAYQLAFLHRMTDHIYTHISARVPGDEAHFLINAYGLTFDEITPESLVKVDLDGKIILDETGLGINPAGYVIHSAIHGVRHDVGCVMHTHTAAGVAVAAQERGLLMLSQHAMRFHDRLSYHDYEGVALELGERQRLIADLGSTHAMILRNHGLLVCGVDVPDAFDAMYYLERACQIQVNALAGNMKVIEPAPEIAEKVARQFDRPDRTSRAKQWPAMLRMLERNKSRPGV